MKAIYLKLLDSTDTAVRQAAAEVKMPLAAWIDQTLRAALKLPPEHRRARTDPRGMACPNCGYSTTPRRDWSRVRIDHGRFARVCPVCSWTTIPVVAMRGAK